MGQWYDPMSRISVNFERSQKGSVPSFRILTGLVRPSAMLISSGFIHHVPPSS